MARRKCNPDPLAYWGKGKEHAKGKQGDCKPCGLAASTGKWMDVLDKRGYSHLADQLASALEGDRPHDDFLDALASARKTVDPGTRSKLDAVTCAAQRTIGREEQRLKGRG